MNTFLWALLMTLAIKKHHVICNNKKKSNKKKKIRRRKIIQNWAKFLLLISRGKFYSFKNMVGCRRKWQPTPVFLPGKVHGQRSLAGCSPWGYMTEHVCMRVEGDGLVAINW